LARLSGHLLVAAASKPVQSDPNAGPGEGRDATESFFNSLKNERVHGVRYATRAEAASDLFQYIAVFYNRSRRHSTLGYLSPTTFLRNWIERQDQQEKAA
jgi:hypothetical protein